LAGALARCGSRLVLRRGDSWAELQGLVAVTGAAAVLWNRRYESWAIEQDRAVKAGLRARGVEARSFNGSLCREPWETTHGVERPYERFSFFASAWLERGGRVPGRGVGTPILGGPEGSSGGYGRQPEDGIIAQGAKAFQAHGAPGDRPLVVGLQQHGADQAHDSPSHDVAEQALVFCWPRPGLAWRWWGAVVG
jgi:hypothetical protein